MSDRSVLGAADVSDEELTEMVAAMLGEPADAVEVVEAKAEQFPYDLPAITTAGRYWVSGRATVRGGDRPFRFFVKHVQSWGRSPYFEQVPEEFREMAEAGVPWRTEPLLYRSDLADRLPDGLTMPRSFGVFDLDEKSAAIWLEAVETRDLVWDADQLRRAAFLLGRLAGSRAVAELADIAKDDWSVHTYVFGRLEMQVKPMLLGEDIWGHPLLAASFPPGLLGRLREAVVGAPAYAEELVSMPAATGHGDACTNNLLGAVGREELVLIDYGFWGPRPVGFDLAQLLVGDVQLGRRPAADLPWMEEVCLPAYVEGLAAEGFEATEDVVRRAHALQLLLFSGLSAFPLEHVEAEPTPELFALAADRAALSEFSLGLVEATS